MDYLKIDNYIRDHWGRHTTDEISAHLDIPVSEVIDRGQRLMARTMLYRTLRSHKKSMRNHARSNQSAPKPYTLDSSDDDGDLILSWATQPEIKLNLTAIQSGYEIRSRAYRNSIMIWTGWVVRQDWDQHLPYTSPIMTPINSMGCISWCGPDPIHMIGRILPGSLSSDVPSPRWQRWSDNYQSKQIKTPITLWLKYKPYPGMTSSIRRW